MSGETMYDINLWLYNHGLETTPPIVAPNYTASEMQTAQAQALLQQNTDIQNETSFSTLAGNAVSETASEVTSTAKYMSIAIILIIIVFAYFYFKLGRLI